MSEGQGEAPMDVHKARAVLDQARLDHTRAMLALRNDPSHPEARQQFRDAVRTGRTAWRQYQAAATAGLAAQIEGIVPSDFQGEGPTPQE